MTRVVEVVALTHRGAVRAHNEDALVLGDLVVAGVDMSAPVRLTFTTSEPITLAVADGMGGHAGGRLASRRTVELLAAAPPSEASTTEVLTRILEVDTDLGRLARQRDGLREMGTTVAGLTVGAAERAWFAVGDSPVYQMRGRYLGRLSEDDVTMRNGTRALTAWLGPRAQGSVLAPQVGLADTDAGLRWLICSDGLSECVDVAEMEAVLAGSEDDVRAVADLWSAAMAASGHDNISVVLVTVRS